MTGLDIIASALRKINTYNVGDVGDLIEAPDAQTGLEALNDMLEAWSIDRLTIYTIAPVTYSLAAGQSSYTIGQDPAGVATADFDAPRPARIESANLLAGGIPYPLHLATDNEWAARGLRNFSAIPVELYNDSGYPLSTLSLYPEPAGVYELELFTWQALQQFADISTTYYFPPAYARALKNNLAIELAPEYDREPSATLIKLAAESKAAIENLNIVTPTQQVDPAVLTRTNGRQSRGWVGNYR